MLSVIYDFMQKLWRAGTPKMSALFPFARVYFETLSMRIKFLKYYKAPPPPARNIQQNQKWLYIRRMKKAERSVWPTGCEALFLYIKFVKN
ncbi:MAG: hypothetical protein LBC53_00175 [Spirochaetaceae bacterium]|nr:hypothetical protein [Spirochaetaceae bacterium]